MAQTPGTNVISEEQLRKQIEAQQRMLAKVATSSKFISFKGGNIIIDKKAIAGAKTEVVALAFMAERTFFGTSEGPGEFDQDVRQSPACYAYGDLGNDAEAEMRPHSDVKDKQAETCEDCQWNKWNTAKKGRGKACRESVRVALLPAQADLSRAETWHARVPITSVGFFKDFAGGVLGFGKAIYSVVAELRVVPDDKHFFHVFWESRKEVPEKYRGFVATKAAQAQANIAFPYPNFDDEGEKPKAKVNTKLTKQKR